MFSTGQLIFALLFALVFGVIIILSYMKDKKLHEKNYKGARWVAVAFVTFVLLLFLIKSYLKA